MRFPTITRLELGLIATNQELKEMKRTEWMQSSVEMRTVVLSDRLP